jgi:hypothetical protein
MNYKLSKKNADNKWWTYGSFKKSDKYGTYSANFKVSSLRDLIELAGTEEWITLSAFEDTPKEDQAF